MTASAANPRHLAEQRAAQLGRTIDQIFVRACAALSIDAEAAFADPLTILAVERACRDRQTVRLTGETP